MVVDIVRTLCVCFGMILTGVGIVGVHTVERAESMSMIACVPDATMTTSVLIVHILVVMY